MREETPELDVEKLGKTWESWIKISQSATEFIAGMLALGYAARFFMFINAVLELEEILSRDFIRACLEDKDCVKTIWDMVEYEATLPSIEEEERREKAMEEFMKLLDEKGIEIDYDFDTDECTIYIKLPNGEKAVIEAKECVATYKGYDVFP